MRRRRARTAGRRGAVAGRDAAAGAVLPALPARAVRRAAAAGGDRRRAGARARGDHRRRAGLEPRRVDPRRDPGAAAAAARRPRPDPAGGDPRPRPGLEHRRPDRGDVPRPDRRGRHHRGGAAARRSTPTPGRCCRWSPRSSEIEPVVLTGETPDPTRVPDGCRFHPRCPALADGDGRARRDRRTTAAARRWPCCPPPASTAPPATSTPTPPPPTHPTAHTTANWRRHARDAPKEPAPFRQFANGWCRQEAAVDGGLAGCGRCDKRGGCCVRGHLVDDLYQAPCPP